MPQLPTTPTGSRKKQALVIDDDEDLREVIGDVLATMDFEVIGAGSASDGLAAVEQSHKLDLIVIDFWLAGFSGGELVQLMREKHPLLAEVPTLLLSGDRDGASLAAKYGITSYLSKPPDLSQLMREVGKLVN